jgi:hypothetical protein
MRSLEMKFCRHCNTEKSVAEFYARSGFQCKECKKLATRNRYLADPAKKRAVNEKWKVANKERNRATMRVHDLKRYADDPAKTHERNRRRQCEKVNATPKWVNSEFEKFFLKEIYALATLRSKLTGVNHHVDHNVPLTSTRVQGFHCSSNLQILEAHQNYAKGNRQWPDMW